MCAFSTNGNISGMMMAAARLLNIVYVVSDVSLPPNLPVITAAAPAVGHTRQIISHSASSAWLKPGVKCRNKAIARHDSNWNSTSQTCQQVMRMSRGFTLQNVANSIMNSTVGIRNSAVSSAAGFIGASSRT